MYFWNVCNIVHIHRKIQEQNQHQHGVPINLLHYSHYRLVTRNEHEHTCALSPARIHRHRLYNRF
jgi:hypothetical protein